MNDERNSDGYRIGHETSMCPGMPLPGDVLCGAGFDSGTRASPGGRLSDATKAVPGYVVDTVGWGTDVHMIVDHIGTKREAALAGYAAALTAVGYRCEVAAKSEVVAKRVVHVYMPEKK